MQIVDRIVAIVRPKQKMLDWLNQQPSVQANFQLQNLQSDCTALLIPAFESPRQAKEYIQKIFTSIFESELLSWGVSEGEWPDNRTFELFTQWFHIEFHSMVLDITSD